ncbi:unnamed protein product [Brassica oleracea]
MMNWTSSFSIWRKPNRILLSPHHLRSPGFSQRRISPMIFFGVYIITYAFSSSVGCASLLPTGVSFSGVGIPSLMELQYRWPFLALVAS